MYFPESVGEHAELLLPSETYPARHYVIGPAPSQKEPGSQAEQSLIVLGLSVVRMCVPEEQFSGWSLPAAHTKYFAEQTDASPSLLPVPSL